MRSRAFLFAFEFVLTDLGMKQRKSGRKGKTKMNVGDFASACHEHILVSNLLFSQSMYLRMVNTKTWLVYLPLQGRLLD